MDPRPSTPPIVANSGKQQGAETTENRANRPELVEHQPRSATAIRLLRFHLRVVHRCLLPLFASSATRHASRASRYQSDCAGSRRVLFFQNTAVISPGFSSPL